MLNNSSQRVYEILDKQYGARSAARLPTKQDQGCWNYRTEGGNYRDGIVDIHIGKKSRNALTSAQGPKDSKADMRKTGGAS